jgi:antitoxin Phd
MMISDKCYTMTQASQRLPDILTFVEQGHAVELTRRGKPVAMVVSITEYQSLYERSHGDFWQALQEFRQQNQDMGGIPEWHEALADVRETTPGRDMTW